MPVLVAGSARGMAVATFDPATQIGQSWREASRLLSIMAFALAGLCVAVYAALARALRPTRAVGAALNFHAGHLAQAPRAMQRWGLEWAFRLSKEPRRLWRRYLLVNPMYLGLFALQAAGLYVIEPSSAQPPQQEMRYG